MPASNIGVAQRERLTRLALAYDFSCVPVVLFEAPSFYTPGRLGCGVARVDREHHARGSLLADDAVHVEKLQAGDRLFSTVAVGSLENEEGAGQQSV